MSTWVDFNKLRHALNFEEVLKYYGVEIKRKKQHQHMGFCPLPTHNGNGTSPSFSASLDEGIWQCFGCGARGNILHFGCRMEKLNPEDGREFRKAALIMQKRFLPDTKVTRTHNPKAGFKAEAKEEPKLAPPPPEKPVLVNPPLDFELKDLNREHPYLASRNLTKETVEHFGLGFCSRGYFKNRVVIPLHSGDSRLIGYAGRIINDDQINEHSPKYLFPGMRDRDGETLEFRKSEFLYNGHRLKGPVDDLVVVEGLFSVHWLYQCELPNTVGLMGWACSEQQAESIVSHVKPGGRVWILSDGDEAGERCAVNVFQLVAPYRAVRWSKLTDGRQPTDLTREELRILAFK